ncbi:MAG: PAS domain-containing protein [Lachnospiraceae bacterium]|nr:PAS domain-containing protein [Lachnospiraceae bacterium]
MKDITKRRERYIDGFALTKYTMPVVRQMSSVIPGGFFIYREDESQELIFHNQRLLEIFGCKTLDEFKELTGYTFKGMVYGPDYDRIQAAIDNQIDDEDSDNLDHVEYRICRKDGEIRWVDDYGKYSYSPEFGDVYFVFITDITDRMEMLKSEIHLEQLLQASGKVAEDLRRMDLSAQDEVFSHLRELDNELERLS